MGLWIRLEVRWQRDPHVVTLDGVTRHVLQTLWCLGAEEGEPTWEGDEPKHAKLPLHLLEPNYLAREAGLTAEQVSAAVTILRDPIPATDFSPESPARLTIDVGAGEAIIRNVGKYQREVLMDRERKKSSGGSGEAPGRLRGTSVEAPRKLRRKGAKRAKRPEAPRNARTSLLVHRALPGGNNEGVSKDPALGEEDPFRGDES